MINFLAVLGIVATLIGFAPDSGYRSGPACVVEKSIEVIIEKEKTKGIKVIVVEGEKAKKLTELMEKRLGLAPGTLKSVTWVFYIDEYGPARYTVVGFDENGCVLENGYFLVTAIDEFLKEIGV